MSTKQEHELDSNECPLCMEPFELDDTNFYPCACGYQICRFCWHRIKTDESGLCPACRQPYTENPAEYTPLTQDQISKLKQKKKTKSNEKKQKQIENRKNLSEVRVVQKNLVFVVGLSKRLADSEVLKRPEYFGKFGKIQKIVINTNTVYHGPQGASVSAYVTYQKTEDASKAIQAVNNAKVDGRILKVSFGTTKYCSNFLKGASCPKTDCMYLHELGEEEASFTKEDMAQGKHQLYETATLSQSTVTKEIVFKEIPRRTTPTQSPKPKDPPKVQTPPMSHSALPASASWASKTQSKDTPNSPPKSYPPYLPPSTQQPKGPLVQSPTPLDAQTSSPGTETKIRQVTPDKSPVPSNSPQRQISSPNPQQTSQSPNSYTDSGNQGIILSLSPTRRNGEGDLDTLSPVTPTHSTGASSPDNTLVSQQTTQTTEVNRTIINNEANLFSDTTSIATIQNERNVFPIRNFNTFASAPGLDLGILGTAWGNSDPTDQSFSSSQTPLNPDSTWEYLHSEVPLASDAHIPLHRSNQSDLSMSSQPPDPHLGLELTANQSAVSSIKLEPNSDSLKELTLTKTEGQDSIHTTDSMLHSRRASLGNIQVNPSIVPYGQEPITHPMQNIGLADPINRVRSSTGISSPSPDINLFQEPSHPNNNLSALDRRNSVDSSIRPIRTPFDPIDIFRPVLFPTHSIRPQSYLSSTNQQLATHNSTPYPSHSNGRQGMELQTGNRNYDIMTNSTFTPFQPPPRQMDEWYKVSHDTWHNSCIAPHDHLTRHRPDREELFKAPGSEKQRLLGGGTHWAGVPTLTEPELPNPPGFGTTNQIYQNRSVTQFPVDTQKPLIGSLPHSTAEHMYLRQNNNYPPSTQMDPPYPYTHSNPYPMLPREQSYPIGHLIDSHQPLIFQSGTNNLDSIDTVPYKLIKNAQTPEFEYINTGLVKNKPTNTFQPKYQERIPNSFGAPPRYRHNTTIGQNSIQSDANITKDKQYMELNEISQQNTKYLGEYK